SPWVAIRNKMFDQVYKGAACFGLTPADVSGVRTVEKPTTIEAKRKFFGGPA
ncbi:MAG: P27 family phage terminase small subunit, partial [Desulfuromonadales bacterium]|nr:P27 family phage terminase small subunit [Desulfuromonadales bacterium]